MAFETDADGNLLALHPCESSSSEASDGRLSVEAEDDQQSGLFGSPHFIDRYVRRCMSVHESITLSQCPFACLTRPRRQVGEQPGIGGPTSQRQLWTAFQTSPLWPQDWPADRAE
jgi:hypothetical protein